MSVGRYFEGASELTQVIFVHDYLQLAFQELGMSIYSAATVSAHGVTLHRGDPGYCDALVNLIGQPVTSVAFCPGDAMRMTFSSGTTIAVSLRPADCKGPEYFQLDRIGLPILVEQVE